MKEDKLDASRRKSFEIPKPVKVGDVIEITVEAQGRQGDGIAKVDGFVVFVKGGVKGEKCRVKIEEVRRTHAIAKKA